MADLGWVSEDNREESEENDVKLTWMSVMIRLFIKLRLLPVQVDKEFTTAKCKFWSSENLTHTIIWILMPLGGLSVICFFFMYAVNVALMTEFEDNLIDAISTIMSILTGLSAFFTPYLVASGLSHISPISLARNLKWPRNGITLIVSFCIMITGSALASLGFVVHMYSKLERYSEAEKILSCFIQSCIILTVYVFFYIYFFIVSSCMSKLIEYFQDVNAENTLIHAKKCMSLFEAFNKGFGGYFLLVFSCFQVHVTFDAFVFFSEMMYQPTDIFYSVCKMIGWLFTIIASIIAIVTLTSLMENGHKQLGLQVETVRKQIMEMKKNGETSRNGKTVYEAKCLLEVKYETPLIL